MTGESKRKANKSKTTSAKKTAQTKHQIKQVSDVATVEASPNKNGNVPTITLQQRKPSTFSTKKAPPKQAPSSSSPDLALIAQLGFNSAAPTVAAVQPAGSFSFEALGLKPLKPARAPAVSASSSMYGYNDALIQYTIIQHKGKCIIVLKFCSAINPAEGAYVERVFDLAVKSNLPWTVPLNIDEILPYKTRFHRNNVEVKNSGGYGLRLFTIAVETKPEKAAGQAMMKYIADNLSGDPKLKGNVFVVPDSLFIENKEFSTWSEIIGANNALMLLQKSIGTDTAADGWFEANKHEVYAYFGSGTFSPDLCRIFKAPVEECIDPSAFEPMVDEPLESETEDAKKLLEMQEKYKHDGNDNDDSDIEDNTLKLNGDE